MTKVEVKFLSQVDETNCIGCKLCEAPCPTEAIKVVQKKAKVDNERCLGCHRCHWACPEDVIRMVPRPEPIVLGVDPAEVDQARLTELCIKAHLHPKQFACLCTGTRVDEVAAAILKGARSLEEISLMTGIRTGCGMYCAQPGLRLLKAYGVEIAEPKGHRWYSSTPTLWDIPEEVKQKYPGFYFEEDKSIYRKI